MLARDPDRQLEVPGDGDCFFNSLWMMAGPHLRSMGQVFGWGDREPSLPQMRAAIAQALERSYRAHAASESGSPGLSAASAQRAGG
jgi:hypothetical protein